jgi:hypothetical protein
MDYSVLRECFGCIALFLASALSASAGVGGGSINVPIFLGIFEYSFKRSTILSLCTLVGNYTSQLLINATKSHPTSPKRTLVYWDAIFVLLPAELAGANVGVLLEVITPDTILYILAIVVVIVAGAVSLDKALQLMDRENTTTAAERAPLFRSSSNNSGSSGIITMSKGATKHSGNLEYSDEDRGFEDEEYFPSPEITVGRTDETKSWCSFLPTLLQCATDISEDEEKRKRINYPWKIISIILITWVFYVICYVVMKEYSTCSLNYYLALGVLFLILFVEVVWGLIYVKNAQKKSLRADRDLRSASAAPTASSVGISSRADADDEVASLLFIGELQPDTPNNQVRNPSRTYESAITHGIYRYIDS